MAARFLQVPAWRSRPPLLSIGGDPFVLRARVRAAVSRLAGIADWTTQPRRDAANYPSGSPAPTEEGGIPRGNRLRAPDTRVALLLHTPPPSLPSSPLISPRISLTGRLLCSFFPLSLSLSPRWRKESWFKGLIRRVIKFVFVLSERSLFPRFYCNSYPSRKPSFAIRGIRSIRLIRGQKDSWLQE